MNLKFVCCLMTLLPAAAAGQQVAIMADKMNIAYLGLNNPLTIVAANYPCDEISVTTDNGSIRKNEDCGYDFYPAKAGIANILVFNKGKEEIGAQKYRIKYLPAPTGRVAGKTGGSVGLAEFKAQIGIAAYLDGFDFQAHFAVSGFKIGVYRAANLIYDHLNKGARFDSSTRSFFQTLQINDRVLFSDVRCACPDNRVHQMADMEFIMIE
jgi:hypothetical protein